MDHSKNALSLRILANYQKYDIPECYSYRDANNGSSGKMKEKGTVFQKFHIFKYLESAEDIIIPFMTWMARRCGLKTHKKPHRDTKIRYHKEDLTHNKF